VTTLRVAFDEVLVRTLSEPLSEVGNHEVHHHKGTLLSAIYSSALRLGTIPPMARQVIYSTPVRTDGNPEKPDINMDSEPAYHPSSGHLNISRTTVTMEHFSPSKEPRSHHPASYCSPKCNRRRVGTCRNALQ
jgi:hypothetical protein